MLKEQKARSCSHDAKHRTASIAVGTGGCKAREENGAVLLGKDGVVVGVDVGPDTPGRTVVLVGRHEDVVRTTEAKLEVSRDARGDIASVIVHGVDSPRS